MHAKHLKPHHLVTAYTEWLRQGRAGRAVSANTIRHAHELAERPEWGVRRELLSRNVAALVCDDDLPKAVKPKPLALTDDEVRELLEAARNPTRRAKKRRTLSSQLWFYPAVAFSVYSGARRGEVVALRWADQACQQYGTDAGKKEDRLSPIPCGRLRASLIVAEAVRSEPPWRSRGVRRRGHAPPSGARKPRTPWAPDQRREESRTSGRRTGVSSRLSYPTAGKSPGF